jgi:hypothetical protein
MLSNFQPNFNVLLTYFEYNYFNLLSTLPKRSKYTLYFFNTYLPQFFLSRLGGMICSFTLIIKAGRFAIFALHAYPFKLSFAAPTQNLHGNQLPCLHQ